MNIKKAVINFKDGNMVIFKEGEIDADEINEEFDRMMGKFNKAFNKGSIFGKEEKIEEGDTVRVVSTDSGITQSSDFSIGDEPDVIEVEEQKTIIELEGQDYTGFVSKNDLELVEKAGEERLPKQIEKTCEKFHSHTDADAARELAAELLNRIEDND